LGEQHCDKRPGRESEPVRNGGQGEALAAERPFHRKLQLSPCCRVLVVLEFSLARETWAPIPGVIGH
jgi:hypothetical protein